MTFSRRRDALPLSASTTGIPIPTTDKTLDDLDTEIDDSTGELPTDTDREHTRNPELVSVLTLHIL